jgi:hypothetical protein
MTTIVSIAQGGTGSNSAALARTALGVPPSAAYDQANTARDQANTARTQANTAYDQANTARTQANTAYGQANAAYGAANTRLSASGGTLSGDLIITGNLTVSGNSTTLNTEILTVEDADIVLLSNVASTPALNAGIIVNRGTSTNTFLRWNEAIDEWGWSDSGTTTYYFEDLRQGLGTINTTFGTTNTTFGTVNTTFATLNTSAGTQNTAITTANDQANSARGQANTAYGQANAAYGQANVAYGQANAAYSAANNRVLKAGDTMTGQLNISAGGLLVTGNVGIGTSSPGYKLTVAGASGSAVLSLLESGVRSWGIRAGGTATNTFDIADFTAAATRLTIDSSGNLGIGTTTPGAKLEAYRNSSGEVARFTAAADGFRSLKFISSDNTGSGAVWTRDIDSAYAQHRWAKSGTPLMVLNESGNLGIGTTNPNVRLDVRGIIQGQAYTLPDTGESAQWVKVGTLTAPQMGRTVHIRAYIHAGFNANNNQDFYLDIFFKTSNGNSVDGSGFAGNSWYYTNGFNATNPTPKWVANAAGVNAASYDLYLYLPHYTNTSHYIVEMVTSDVTWVNSGSTGQSDPGSASSTVCIASLGFNVPIGNVGIGTTSPNAKTEIYGSADTSGYSSIQLGDSNGGIYRNGSAQSNYAGNSSLNLITVSSHPIGFSTSNSLRMIIDGSGNVGIGTTNPSSSLHVYGNTQIYSGSTGNSPPLIFGSETGAPKKAIFLENYWMVYQGHDNEGHKFRSVNSGGSSTDDMTITGAGLVLINTSTSSGYGSGHRITRSVSEGGYVISIDGGVEYGALFQAVSGAGYSSAAAAQWIGKNSSTNRSINAGGTVNASGADYAEYMEKAGEFIIAKGDICGINSNGKLTNVYSDAIAFVVKSTNPSYVGGDGWGAGFKDDPEGLEAARQKVDRVAFSGQVPVNVIGATPGQYIIPVNDNDVIRGIAVTNPTFEQYQISVGKVVAIEEDGRARIIVKVA